MKKSCVTFSLILLLIPFTSAATFINIFVDESGNAIFLGETDESPQLPDGITLEGNQIAGTTAALTSKQGEIWEFILALQGAELNVILPEGAIVKDLNQGEISLSGNRIAIYVQNEVTVQYTIEPITEPFVPSSNIPLALVLLAILIILIAFLVNYTKREKKQHTPQAAPRPQKKDKLEIIKQVLSEREKLIIDNVKKTGKIKSSYLRKMTDIPKASFSRHIQELEKKGLIKRSGEGKNKFVELVK